MTSTGRAESAGGDHDPAGRHDPAGLHGPAGRHDRADLFDPADLLDVAYDLLVVVDEQGTLAYVSGASRHLLGCEPGDLLGRDVFELVHPDDVEHALAALSHHRDRVHTPRIVSRLRHADGSWVPLELTATNAFDIPSVGGLVISAREAVAVARDHREGRAVQFVYTLLHHVGDAVLACDRDLNITVMNRAMTVLVGLPTDRAQPLRLPQGLEFLPVAHGSAVTGAGTPRDGADPDGLLLRPLRGDPVVDEEWIVRRPDGSERRVSVNAQPLADSSGDVFGSVSVFHDVTEQRRHEQELLHLATHDALTGVANRRLLLTGLAEAIDAASDSGERAAVLLCDVDHFKEINDTLGHEHGDRLLVALSGRLREAAGPTDTLARLGGDEFVLVTRVADAGGARRVADRLVALFREPVLVGERSHPLSVSIGVALSAPSGVGRAGGGGTRPDTPDTLLQQADIALYLAKERGGRGYEVFDAAYSRAAEQRLLTRELLTRSLSEDELGLAYQPIVDLEDGRIVGAEAHVRLLAPNGHVLLPGQFLPLARRSGLQVPLDLAVLRRAVAATAHLAQRLQRTPGITCNLSAESLARPDLSATVVADLDRHGVPAEVLCLELVQLTRSGDGAELDSVTRRNVEHLADAGVQVGLDDIGSASGALDLLRDLPFSFVKLGHRFVGNLPGRRQDEAIVRAVVELGSALSLDVRVDGVERVEQAAMLRNLGCRFAQGFLFSRPLSEREYAARAAAGS
jgi:diguanylate cyclase (GGDEF)-like protein/PAS domain S-box-containing protein